MKTSKRYKKVTRRGALKAVAALRKEAIVNRTSDMSLEEINKEINRCRKK